MSQAEQSSTAERREAHHLRRGSLGVLGISFFVISAAAPLTAMAGGAPVAMLLGNGAGIPAAYVLISLLLLVFSVGYTAMARHHTSTGAFYSYVSRGLRQPAGGAAAWIALLGYNAMQIGLYGLFGAAATGFLADQFGWDLPWWLVTLIAMAVIAVLGYRQVDLSVKVLSVLVAAEFLIVLILDVAIAVKGGQGGGAPLTLEPFSWSALTSGSLAIALLFNAASFIGFEATTIYSEEARDPRRTVPRATYVAVLTIGLFYSVTTWLMVNGQGPDSLVGFLGDLKPDPTAFLFVLSDTYIGGALTTIMTLLFATSVFAALLAFHNAVARYLFALGREGLVPERLGRTHKVHLSPHAGSISQTALAVVIVAIFAITGQDPVLALFTWLTQLGTLAIITLMALASFAVVAFFLRHPDLDHNRLRTFVAPTAGGIATAAVAIYAASQFGLLIGNEDSVLSWLLPALIVVAAVAGVLSAFVLRARDPQLYAVMGRHRGDA
ncbi:APC family permease [Actinoplanes bogorensis]|uniref:APC family permease n=1 Tax=Paractinoplanes bogorensis TaxID=1610840 RepID=A0ABS5YVF0_9ACTN|nr:APC family permease [Actinoplanes bogorensis]MBU2667343.1 APC family permease [Actinoplanes bogorensis]